MTESKLIDSSRAPVSFELVKLQRERLEKLMTTAYPYAMQALGVVAPGMAAELALKRFTTPPPIARPPWEKVLKKAGRSFRLPSGTSATVWGDRDQPVVLLVHGWAGRGTQLGKLIEPLRAKGLRVVAWDGPAHGDSDGKQASIGQFAQGLRELNEVEGPWRLVVAHSFGAGAVTLALSCRWMQSEAVALVAAPSGMGWVVEGFAKRLKMSTRTKAVFIEKLNRFAGVEGRDVGIAHLAKTNALKTPVIVIHDPEDAEVPFQQAEEIARDWHGARLVALSGVGHRKILKAPTFIASVLEFLDEIESLKNQR